ncbi:hypothetical protein C1S82_07665 [Mycolicibacterium cosmeticum]|uniref:Uncharacterized protein n=1 Tax=Mycolicibacterium cosmeticum TaxID=258533 RepID=W9AYE2_MYCCO|nr:hypothetical protein [Mycolicibacterium cosmeticum]TLH80693.1 hypothetical protein C1S82_07665 [Mycolicibacterium cosmeticum]CDO07957.1 hypothetical protein BN977_02773 [Mycolicibacterium cosmeticum]
MGVLTPVLICDLYRMRSQTTGALFRLSDTPRPGGHGLADRQTTERLAFGMPASSATGLMDIRKPKT